MEVEKLDNPVWHALSDVHQAYAWEDLGMKFYKPEYCPFGSFIDPQTTILPMVNYSLLTDNFFVVGDKPNNNSLVHTGNLLVCDQMLLKYRINLEITELLVKLHNTAQKKDLLALVNLVQPGYFREQTIDLGSYYGIYKDNKLVAAAGERMQMIGFTEISAIVTHPQYTGRGYAKQLITHISNQIFENQNMPFLHVAETNVGAIALYEKLGFARRRKMNFWNFTRADQVQ